MKAHILQHVPFEGPGSIAGWLADREAAVTFTKFYESPFLPDPADADFLIVMGGPMSVHDTSDYPWLTEEKEFIRRVIGLGRPVLGICLGAQLIAAALGSPVYKATQKEIGWFPVIAEATAWDVFKFPPTATVFHWHGETFDLPEGAVRLARSAACPNQAFQFGDNVIGLQFHLETTPESASLMLANCGDELVEGEFIQDAQSLVEAPAATYGAANDLMAGLLTYLCPSAIP
jgi:GMP synthase-like glutamine amidotransferase